MSRADDALSTLAAFVETYFVDETGRPLRLSRAQRWACDQMDVGLFVDGYAGYAVEMHRGGGKSMLMKAAVIRALLKSFRYAALLTAGTLYKQFSRDIACIITGVGAPLAVGSTGRPLLHVDHDIRPAQSYPDRSNKEAQLWNVPDRLFYVGGWGNEHKRRVSVRGMNNGRGDVRGLVDGVQRPDLLLVDDPMKEGEADNAEITDNTKRFVKQSFIPCGPASARLGFSGTPYNDHDLITEAAGNASTKPIESVWPRLTRVCLPAIHPVTGALCSPHWTRADLEHRREIVGSRAFNQEYLLDPHGGGVRHFEAKWIEKWTMPVPKFERGWSRLMFLDPSLGRSSRTGDPSAIVVVDIDPSEVAWVRVCDVQRRRPAQLVADYLAIWERWHPTHHAVEDAGAQELLIPIFESAIRDQGLPIEAIPRLQSVEGVPKVTRIKRLSSPVEFGRIRWDVEGSHRELRAQAVGWGGTPNEPDDALDALEGAIRLGSKGEEFTGTPGVVANLESW